MIDSLSQFYTADIGTGVVVLRLGAAAILGLLIGLDRELRAMSAGLRTHMLVSLAAATFAILAFEIVARATAEGVQNPDPVRIIEAVTAGVAFLAAGTIIRGGGRIRGLTTGAAMWLAGAIGLACGVGAFFVALVATALGMTILTVIRWIEHATLLKDDRPDGDADT